MIFTVIPCAITGASAWIIRTRIAKKQWRSIMDYSRMTHHGYVASLEESPLQKCLADLRQARLLLILASTASAQEGIASYVPEYNRTQIQDTLTTAEEIAQTSRTHAAYLHDRAAQYESIANHAYNIRKERGQPFNSETTAELEKLRDEIEREGREVVGMMNN